MNSTEFKTKYGELKNIFDSYAERVFSDVSTKSRLSDAMKYSLFAGGKRVRPVLMLYMAELLGGKEEEFLPFAFSLECIHTYSLIHDDLPALDNDSLRRGKPTNHIVFGEATALLAGDALLNFAFEHSLENCDTLHKVAAVKKLAEFSGYRGMLEGQSLDMEGENTELLSEEKLFDIIEYKTGKFIEAALVMPTIVYKDELTVSAEELGSLLGRLFQFADDLSDVEKNSCEMGKTAGKDAAQNKPSAVRLYGKEKLKEEISALEQKCKTLSFSIDKYGFLECFTDYIVGKL